MATTVRTWRLGDLATALGAELTGDPELPIERPVPAGMADPKGVTFAGDARYLAKALSQPIGAVIVGVEVGDLPVAKLSVPDPRTAFGRLLGLMARPLPLAEGIHPTAVIAESSQVHPTSRIGAHTVIESGAVVGPNARVYAQCYIGEGCTVGEGTIIYPRVTLYQDVIVGRGCILHSGCVLGADGFGFVWDGDKQAKVPQVGNVVLGDYVEVGANTCIDRATAGSTTVGTGTKLDDLVMIGHNTQIGQHTAFAALVGIGGSCEIGSRVIMGGQAGMADHVTIGDNIVLGGRSGVITDMQTPGEYMGLPPVPVTQAVRALALTQRLPELFQRLRALEAKAFKP